MGAGVVIAPDSFKGSIRADAAAAAIATGWHRVRPADEVRRLPMADGGEGTVDAFASAVPGATRMPVAVDGPTGEVVETCWLWLPPTPDARGGTGIVELASTSGIETLGSARALRPLEAHTRGFGQAIARALDHGVSRLILGIGSSASTDGGVGLLTALGARFTGDDGVPIGAGGRWLGALAAADLTDLRPLPEDGVFVLRDVTNPLLGPNGAAATFGPQKGADEDDVAVLEHGLTRLSTVLGIDPQIEGAGAAGGAGYGLLAWGARLVPGARAVAELIGLRSAVLGAAVVVTGEGSFDGQSSAGKVPGYVSGLAHGGGRRLALVAGRIAAGADVSAFAAAESLTALAGSPERAMRDPAHWLELAGMSLARSLG